MSKSAVSAKVFAVYLFLVGFVLVFSPNLLLSIFRIPATSEVWVRVVGLTVFNIGVFAWVCADFKPFLAASVFTRGTVFIAFSAFALLGLASPAIALFGVLDLLGGAWTYFALRADAQVAKSSLRGAPA